MGRSLGPAGRGFADGIRDEGRTSTVDAFHDVVRALLYDDILRPYIHSTITLITLMTRMLMISAEIEVLSFLHHHS